MGSAAKLGSLSEVLFISVIATSIHPLQGTLKGTLIFRELPHVSPHRLPTDCGERRASSPSGRTQK